MVRGDSATRASDVWSLGVTLHSALSGQPLYDRLPDGSLIEALRHVLTDRPTIDASISGPIASVIKRCLEPHPTDRYRTAAELATALQGVST